MNKNRKRYLLAAVALAIALLLIFPIYWMVMSAVLPTSVTMSRTPPLLPPLDQVSLNAFVEVFTRKPVFTWLFNSITVTASTIRMSRWPMPPRRARDWARCGARSARASS